MIAIDTNIIVYAFDTAYPEKRNIAKKIVSDIFEGNTQAVLTSQILAEFCAVVTKKIERPLSKDQVQSILGAILSSENWDIHSYTGETVLRAIQSSTSFWDALIIETLKEHGVSKIITENVKHFEQSGIIAVNPFTQKTR